MEIQIVDPEKVNDLWVDMIDKWRIDMIDKWRSNEERWKLFESTYCKSIDLQGQLPRDIFKQSDQQKLNKFYLKLKQLNKSYESSEQNREFESSRG